MQTSYFGRWLGKQDPRLVAISLYPSRFCSSRHYPDLAPYKAMLKMNKPDYCLAYQKILDKLDPKKVYDDLGHDAILLCFENPGEFCHRRLVAHWLQENLGIVVPEYEPAIKVLPLFAELNHAKSET